MANTDSRWLIQDGTNRIYRYKKSFAARKDMRPYFPKEEAKEKQAAKPETGAALGAPSSARIAAIVDAIPKLDTKNGYTASGLPDTFKLQEILKLEPTVKAVERDEAWDIFNGGE